MRPRPLRLFVALYPPMPARLAMLDALASVSTDVSETYRVTPAEQLHLTLQFIGDTQERELESVAESVRRSAAGVGAFCLTPVHITTLPERGPPRLIAMETSAPAPLIEIHRRLATRLARKARAGRDDRFLPHLTLGRFRGEARPQSVRRPVSLASFEVESICLVQSILKPAGAVHSTLVEVRL